MTPLEASLHYAARGWRVHPLPPMAKYPVGAPKWQENATTDSDRIRKYYGLNPDHGVCIATGQESGIFAVDIDPDHGGDDSLRALEAKYGELPDTVESLTGGGGRHLLFAWPDEGEIRNSASGVLGVGIDVRGTGGQIVAAPSIHPNGTPYAWEVLHDPLEGQGVAQAPTWLLEMLQAPIGATEPRRPERKRLTGDPLPGDWWEAQTSWPAELARHGWALHSTHADAQGGYYEMWTRPGKTVREGASASLYWQGSDVLKVFTSSAAPLEAERTYTLWGFHVAMTQGSTSPAAMAAAASEVRSTMPKTRTITDFPTTNDDPTPAPQRATIIHNGRQLNNVVDDAIDAIDATNMPPTTFVRAGQLVRLRQDENERPMIETLRSEHVRNVLSDAALWYRSLKDGGLTDTAPPLDVCVSVLARGQWPYPALAGVVELPVLRPDGTFHVEHGHDEATRLYHWHRGQAYDPIPVAPSGQELASAVALVDELFTDFPWDTAADRANAWALLLTPLVRAIIGQVPMALIDAPEPGTGKGLLVKVCSIVTTGHAAALMAWPASDEELEKKVSATLMAGNTVVVFDNVEGMIKSPTLAAVLTADSWQGRVLGRSEVVVVPNRATWAATGNNIDVGGDLARRCYRIRLDARQAQPWLRTGWKHADLEGWALANRSRLLHALCTIVRSWWVAGKPPAVELPAMGGYSAWVRCVGGILDHAGIGHFLANLAEFHASADREAQAWEAFLTAWADRLGEQAVTVGELIAKMADVQFGYQLREVLPEDIAGYWDTPGFSRRLSIALRRRVGRHYGNDGMHLTEMPRDRRQVAIYCVTDRPVQLELDDAEARELRGSSTTPAFRDAVTSDDADSAGVQTRNDPLREEKTYPQDTYPQEKSLPGAGEKLPALPALPRSADSDEFELF